VTSRGTGSAGRLVATVAIVAAVASLSACGPFSHDPDSDLAVWDVGSQQQLSPGSTGFTAIVERTGCTGGEQGTPEKPVIEVGPSTITITFRLGPHIASGTCQGTEGVPYRVRLPEPIGSRTLVDGACAPGGDLGSTGFCLRDGVRLSWRHGAPRLFGVP